MNQFMQWTLLPPAAWCIWAEGSQPTLALPLLLSRAAVAHIFAAEVHLQFFSDKFNVTHAFYDPTP